VGLAVCDSLRSIGLQQFRVRWPNDVLVDDRKLAGLLVDQFVAGLAVAGIGVNVFNQPETQAPYLKNQTVRLADLIDAPPDLRQLTARPPVTSRGRPTHDAGRSDLQRQREDPCRRSPSLLDKAFAS
jgi:hypothetical protein